MGVNIFAKLGLNTDEFRKGISNAKKDASGLNGTFKQISEGFKSGIGIGAGMSVAGMVQGAVTAVKDLAVESAKLAMEAQGVETAFSRFADPKLMNELKDATKGTVSELELMRAAVQAKNFGIPLEQMGSLLKFAHQRAKDTGQSVDYLVQSIIMGIGRKSPLILDNLGISAVALKEKMKGISSETATVGDVAKAVGSIASDAMAGIGQSAITAKEKTAQLGAEWDNFRVNLGKEIISSNVFKGLTDELGFFFKMLNSDALSGGDKFKGVVATIPIVDMLVSGGSAWSEAEKKMNLLTDYQTRIDDIFKKSQAGEHKYMPSNLILEQLVGNMKNSGATDRVITEAKDYWMKSYKYLFDQRNTTGLAALGEANIGFIQGLEDNIKTTGEGIKNALTLKEAIGISIKFKSAKEHLEDAMYQINQAGAGILEGFNQTIAYLKKKIDSSGSLDAAVKFTLKLKDSEKQKKDFEDKIQLAILGEGIGELKPMTPRIAVMPKPNVAGLQEFGLGLKAEFNEIFIDISKTIESGIENLVGTIAEGIGEMAGALAMGENIDAGDFGKKILSTLSEFAMQFGELLIAQGIALKVFETSMSWQAMIAAGVALVAIGAMGKKMTSKSSLSANASSPSSSGSSTSSSSTSNSNTDNRVIFEISKDSLSGVMQRDRTLKSRLV